MSLRWRIVGNEGSELFEIPDSLLRPDDFERPHGDPSRLPSWSRLLDGPTRPRKGLFLGNQPPGLDICFALSEELQ
ncbi:MAG: hypothetical protein KDD47_28880 [Acidobacteria bacterium]|nr:hypothetical protein [Acidobacteriota bacterium]